MSLGAFLAIRGFEDASWCHCLAHIGCSRLVFGLARLFLHGAGLNRQSRIGRGRRWAGGRFWPRLLGHLYCSLRFNSFASFSASCLLSFIGLGWTLARTSILALTSGCFPFTLDA